MALMFMAIAATLATSIAFRQEISIKRTEQVLTTEQAYLYAQSVNQWASAQLLKNAKKYLKAQNSPDVTQTQLIDHFPMKVEQKINGATITGEILDAQSFFNLNTLGDSDAQDAFTRLITLVKPDIKKDDAQAITQATYQWITSIEAIQQQQMAQTNNGQLPTNTSNNPATPNSSSANSTATSSSSSLSPAIDESSASSDNSDDNSEPAAPSSTTTQPAETTGLVAGPQPNSVQNTNKLALKNWDGTYLKENPPYKNPHAPMGSASELRLVHGMTRDLYVALTPYIIALPNTNSKINVNTAAAPVLAATAQNLSLTAAALAVQDREQSPYANLNAYEGSSDLANATVETNLLTVQSQFFLVQATVKMGEQTLVVYTLLMRTGVGTDSIDPDAPTADNGSGSTEPPTTSSSTESSTTNSTSSVINENPESSGTSNTQPNGEPVPAPAAPPKVLTLWQSVGTF